ncbi:MAG: acetoacetate--CoA ligase, partial [Candidatus Bathyarchaeota archaeon]|nr:acetoacetate--CoA ligase [Candidatus Bathyarchaeota archaeon]
MGKLLWQPSEEHIKQANITQFIALVNKKYRLEIDSYAQLYKWSIEILSDFWATMWDFGEIKASHGYDEVIDDLNRFLGARWFRGARLNFAENLLRHSDEHLAFIFNGETQKSAQMTYAEVCNSVGRLARSLREMGVAPGDR